MFVFCFDAGLREMSETRSSGLLSCHGLASKFLQPVSPRCDQEGGGAFNVAVINIQKSSQFMGWVHP